MDNKIYKQHIMELASDVEGISQELFSLAHRLETIPRYNPEEELHSLTKNLEKCTVQHRNVTARFMAHVEKPIYETIAGALNIQVKEERKWIKITVPAILPNRSARDGSLYITQPLRYRLIEFQRANPIERFHQCVICIVHKYDEAMGIKRVRDYDNIEIKRYLDVIESILLTNDSGLYCSVFQTTKITDRDATEFYLMQPETLPLWLEKHLKTDTRIYRKSASENGIDFTEK